MGRPKLAGFSFNNFLGAKKKFVWNSFTDFEYLIHFFGSQLQIEEEKS